MYFCTKMFLQMQQIFIFSYDSCCSFVNRIIFFFSKLIIFMVCFLRDSQNFFKQTSPLYTSCLFSISSNVRIIDIEYYQGICSPPFAVDDLWYWQISNTLVPLEGTPQKSLFSHTFL